MLVKKKLIVRSKQGLHARPAALFVQIANKFNCDITITRGKQEVNGKSIMGILTLAVDKGSRVYIKADGEDAKEAMDELEVLLTSEDK